VRRARASGGAHHRPGANVVLLAVIVAVADAVVLVVGVLDALPSPPRYRCRDAGDGRIGRRARDLGTDAVLLAVGVAVADAVRVLAVGVADAVPVTVPACPSPTPCLWQTPSHWQWACPSPPGHRRRVAGGAVAVEPAVTLAVGVLGAVRVLAVGVVEAVPVPVLCNTLPVK